MKKNVFIGLLVILMVFGLVGCEDGDNGGTGGISQDPNIILNWTEKNLATTSSTETHAFAVTEGKTYYIFIKDYFHSSVASSDTSWASISHTGRYADDSEAYARSGLGNGNTTPVNFISDRNGNVTITVDAAGVLGRAGNYKIAVTTENSRPSGDS
ncbi:MAG: hypothetical protein FWD26_06115 [Treponema sp.]|nr:hypothetical protein [Treponema sp.]